MESGPQIIQTKNLQNTVSKGYRSQTKEGNDPRKFSKENRGQPTKTRCTCTSSPICISKNKTNVLEEEANMNEYMIQLKCLIKNLTVLEEGMIYIDNMKPMSFEPIYVLAQMLAKLYKIRNRMGHLPKENRKHLQKLIDHSYECVIEQCIKRPQDENCLAKIVKDVAYIDEVVTKCHVNSIPNKCNVNTVIRPWFNKEFFKHTSNMSATKIPIKNRINNKKDRVKKSNLLKQLQNKIKHRKWQSTLRTANKCVSTLVKTNHIATQYDPKISGPLQIPKNYESVKGNVRNPWLANITYSSKRFSILENIPPEDQCFYEVCMKNEATNIANRNTKETQTEIHCNCKGDYEYTIMDLKYTKKRTVKEKTEEEMLKGINKNAFLVKEIDVFETFPTNREESSSSPSSTLIEDSDCNIKISNFHSKPSYKSFKMHYSANKASNKKSHSRNDKSNLIKKDTIQHKDEIMNRIKEVGLLFLHGATVEGHGNSSTEH